MCFRFYLFLSDFTFGGGYEGIGRMEVEKTKQLQILEEKYFTYKSAVFLKNWCNL